MKDSTHKDITGLLSLSEKASLRDEAPPLERLGNSLVTFLEDQLGAITRQESFRQIVMNALIDRIQEGDIDPTELRMLFKTISEQKTVATESVLQLFKPSQNAAINPLLPKHSKEDGSTAEEAYASLSIDERQTLDRFMRFLQSKNVIAED